MLCSDRNDGNKDIPFAGYFYRRDVVKDLRDFDATLARIERAFVSFLFLLFMF